MIENILWRAAMRIAPRGQRGWIAAIRAEAATLSGGQEAGWITGAFASALRLRVAEWSYAREAVPIIIAMIMIDWFSGAALPAVFLIMTIGCLLAWRAPTKIWTATLVAGGALPLAHAVANLDRELWPSYQFAPLDGRDAATLMTLFFPAYVAALVSANLRRNLER
jgi:hypothetical protein